MTEPVTAVRLAKKGTTKINDDTVDAPSQDEWDKTSHQSASNPATANAAPLNRSVASHRAAHIQSIGKRYIV